MPRIDKSAAALQSHEVLAQVKVAVAGYYKVPVEIFEEEKKSRKEDVIKLRRMVAYVTKTLFPKVSLATIGRSLGDFTHANVINMLKRVSNLIDTEKQCRADVNKVINTIVNSATIQGAKLREVMNANYFYVNLENIKVLRQSKDVAIVCAGVPDAIVQQIQKLLSPDIQCKEFKNTGLSILEQRT